MAKHPNTQSRIPSASVLALVPERVATFLRGVVLFPAARGALEAGRYGEDEHREGVRLLDAFFEYPPAPASGFLDDVRALGAQDEITSWVRTNFGRLRGALRRVHRTSALFVGLDPAGDSDPVVALATLLARLEHASAEDEPACQTLARRGLHAAERQRLAVLVNRAREFRPSNVEQSRDARTEQLVALHQWHADWADTARSMIRNRNVLAALGIARKRWRTEVASSGEFSP